MTDKTCYELPLSPQDLVAIYKDKENLEEFVLWVDYEKSLKKLTAKHIIIYLANTNFKSTFSSIDEDLILEYISSDFMIDCPLLARIVVNIIKTDLGHDITPQEEQLLPMFNRERMAAFLEKHRAIMDDLYGVMTQMIPFVLHKMYEGLEDQDSEPNLKSYVSEIDIIDKPVNCGPNISRLITSGFDAFLLITHKLGVSDDVNKSIFNDSPKYFGKDLYYILCETGITAQILDFFHEDFIQHDRKAE